MHETGRGGAGLKEWVWWCMTRISVIVVSCRAVSYHGMVYRRVYIYVRIWMLMWIYITACSGIFPHACSGNDDREVR